MRRLLTGRRLDPSAERVLFALVANRALAPSSKLAAASWISGDVLIEGLPATTDDACCRAMDWLPQVKGALEQEVFGRVANLLNLGVDLLFFDTASTYFELGGEDDPYPGTSTATRPASRRKPPPASRPVPGLRQLQRPPRRPTPGRDQHGRHLGRHPGPGLVLAREHG